MKYYVSRTHMTLDSGKLTGYETVLTKPDLIQPTRETMRRMSALGITNLYLCEHPANSRRWGQLDRAQTKRTNTRSVKQKPLVFFLYQIRILRVLRADALIQRERILLVDIPESLQVLFF